MQGVCMCVYDLVRNFLRRMLQPCDLSTNRSNTIQIRALIDGMFDFDWLDSDSLGCLDNNAMDRSGFGRCVGLRNLLVIYDDWPAQSSWRYLSS